MVAKGPSPDKDFKVEVSVAEEKAPGALQDPAGQQRMLGEYLEDKLRAGMIKEKDLTRHSADKIPTPCLTEDLLQGPLDTTWVNKWRSD